MFTVKLFKDRGGETRARYERAEVVSEDRQNKFSHLWLSIGDDYELFTITHSPRAVKKAYPKSSPDHIFDYAQIFNDAGVQVDVVEVFLPGE